MADEIVLVNFEPAPVYKGAGGGGETATISVYFIDVIAPLITTATGVLVTPSPSLEIPPEHKAQSLFTAAEELEFDAGTKMYTFAPGLRLTSEELANPSLAAAKLRRLYAAVDLNRRTRPEAFRVRMRNVGRRINA